MSKRKRRGDGLRKVLIALIVILIAAIGALVWLCIDFATAPQEPAPTAPITLPTTEPDKPHQMQIQIPLSSLFPSFHLLFRLIQRPADHLYQHIAVIMSP